MSNITILHANLSYKVMSLAFTVHNILGSGLLESCYENFIKKNKAKEKLECINK